MLWKQENSLKLYHCICYLEVCDFILKVYICLKHVTTLYTGSWAMMGRLTGFTKLFLTNTGPVTSSLVVFKRRGFPVFNNSEAPQRVFHIRTERLVNTPRFKSAKRKKLPGSIEEQKLFLGLATTEEIPALGQNLPVNLVVSLLEVRCLKD